MISPEHNYCLIEQDVRGKTKSVEERATHGLLARVKLHRLSRDSVKAKRGRFESDLFPQFPAGLSFNRVSFD